MHLTAPKSFSESAAAAFPDSCRNEAQKLIAALSPAIDDSYRKASTELIIHGSSVRIPSRLHFIKSNDTLDGLPEKLRLMGYCLYTRSTDGYLRHTSIKHILISNKSWTIPYIVLLSGEYVVEIIQDITTALPMLDRGAYINFVRENRPLMSLLRSRAASYWDRYYRHVYKEKATYPGLLFLHELERWAN